MAVYHPGDVVLLLFPFFDGSGGKQRPTLVLVDAGYSDIVVARVTSHPVRDGFDVAPVDGATAGLLRPSTVRLHKVATIDKALVRGRLGALTAKDSSRVRQTFRCVWSWAITQPD